MTKDLAYVRKQVIPKLLKHPFALPFKYPVDAITEGIYPDYFMVISHPMDLYTIKARLDHGWYWNLTHCVADINLVWRNACMYNPKDHVLHEWAVTMKSFTYSLLKRLKTHAAWKNEDRLNARNLRQCELILETILKDRSLSEPFKIIAKPNDRISGPMDLDTVERNLNSGQYPNADIFAADFRKLIGRIYRLCEENDPLVENAKELSHKFEFEFAKRILSDEDDIISDHDEEYLKGDVDEDLLNTMLKKANTIGEQLAKLIQDDKHHIESTPDQDGMDHDPAARHMDPATINMSSKELETRRDAAKDLVVKIAALDSEKLKGVVSIVRNDKSPHHISEFTKPEHDEEYLTLDFATMNFETIQNLQEYVSSLDHDDALNAIPDHDDNDDHHDHHDHDDGLNAIPDHDDHHDALNAIPALQS